MSQSDELKFQRGAATNTEGEQGKNGGKKIVIMPTAAWRWRKNL